MLLNNKSSIRDRSKQDLLSLSDQFCATTSIPNALPTEPQQNRPYTVQNIVDALQKCGVKKTAAERALASLTEKGSISKKEYGKTVVSVLNAGRISTYVLA